MVENQIRKAVSDIKAAVQSDGGNIEIIEITDEVVTLKIKKPDEASSCKDCFLPDSMIKEMIEAYITSDGGICPEIKIVEE